VEQPEDVPSYSLVKQKFMPYFSRNVMDPFEARGFSLDYGEQDVKVCGETSKANYETRAEAVAEREKEIRIPKEPKRQHLFVRAHLGTRQSRRDQQTKTDLSRQRPAELRRR
jgi:hypothetical protein